MLDVVYGRRFSLASVSLASLALVFIAAQYRRPFTFPLWACIEVFHSFGQCLPSYKPGIRCMKKILEKVGVQLTALERSGRIALPETTDRICGPTEARTEMFHVPNDLPKGFRR